MTYVLIAAVLLAVVVAWALARRATPESREQRATRDEEAREALRARLRPEYERPAFVPRTADGDPAGAVSKFCGRPWLPDGERWPPCGHCGKPLQLLLQLAFDELPDGAPAGGGLLQLFYCLDPETKCEGACDGWDPFAKSELVRVVDPSRPGATAPRELAPTAFVAKRIVGWWSHTEFPHLEELEDRGLAFSADENEAYFSDESDAFARQGDKLGGWPHWVQNVEYPSCPRCEARMEHVFQIDSEVNVPWMWGDGGIGHITRCPAHGDVLAFAWACY